MCGIVGIYHDNENVCGSIYDGLIQVQHRGQDAVGISTWDKTKMYLHKDTGLVTEVFKTDNSLSQLNGNIGIGTNSAWQTTIGINNICLLYTSDAADE